MGISQQLAASRLIQPGVCTSSTRPASPYEGQCIYETDTDMMALWNGSAWRYIASTTATSGSVLQVVNATYSTQTSTSSTSYVDSGLTASITPKSSSSKILVTAYQTGIGKAGGGGGGYRLALQLVRGSTSISQFELGAGYDGTATQIIIGGSGVSYLDSPATTSSTTYKTQIKGFDGGTVYAQYDNCMSTITLMEIAG